MVFLEKKKVKSYYNTFKADICVLESTCRLQKLHCGLALSLRWNVEVSGLCSSSSSGSKDGQLRVHKILYLLRMTDSL